MKARRRRWRRRRRSEERRVGKECRSRWSPDQSKKKREPLRRRAGRCSSTAGSLPLTYQLMHASLRPLSSPIRNFFFFQAEDGIRDGTVTGVQTCALPIYAGLWGWHREARVGLVLGLGAE